MAGKFEGKVALVTGAGSGIGRASALLFAKGGARVAVADYVTEGGEQTVRTIEDLGGQAIFIKADVSIAKQAEAMVAKTVEAFGRLDYAFNNAGIEGTSTNLVDYTEENFDRLIAINLKGVWLCMKYEIPQMVKQGGGAIVNASSIAGLVGFPSMIAYAASKGAVVQMTRTAALEYAKHNIRVNCTCPGAIETPMIQRAIEMGLATKEQFVEAEPIGRMGRAEEVAAAAVWLCSDAASFVTGHPLSVDGGWAAA